MHIRYYNVYTQYLHREYIGFQPRPLMEYVFDAIKKKYYDKLIGSSIDCYSRNHVYEYLCYGSQEALHDDQSTRRQKITFTMLNHKKRWSRNNAMTRFLL